MRTMKCGMAAGSTWRAPARRDELAGRAATAAIIRAKNRKSLEKPAENGQPRDTRSTRNTGLARPAAVRFYAPWAKWLFCNTTTRLEKTRGFSVKRPHDWAHD